MTPTSRLDLDHSVTSPAATTAFLITDVRSIQQKMMPVGCVAQWLERWSLTGELPCPKLDLQLTGDHFCG